MESMLRICNNPSKLKALKILSAEALMPVSDTALWQVQPPRLTRSEPEAEPVYLVCWDLSLKAVSIF